MKDSSKKSESLPEFLSFSDNTSAADSEVEIPIEDLFKDRKVEKAERRRAKEKSKAKRKKHEMKNVEDHVIKPQHSEPEKLEIKDSCCRQVIGTVCSGDYSFLTAKGKGVGYVTFLGLKKLLLEKSSMCGSTILYRNTTSRCYRSAKLYILT